ncbi:MAG: helix-turn-helix transcriptional regulator [Acidimicrobiales bacterium]
MSKLERLLNLTAALLDTPRPLLVEEIRVRVEGYPDGDDAFKRSFERDKEELRAMGIPVAVESVPGTDPPREGYRVDRQSYQGADPQLAADELAALHLAATLVRLDGVDGDDALRRLGGVVETADTADPVAAIPTPDGLGPLFEAARDARAVTFGYGDEQRRVEPWNITFTRGRWYVTGHDQMREADRRFRVDRIVGEVVIDGDATGPRPEAGHRDTSRLATWEMGDDEPVRALVAIDADQAPWASHHLGVDAIVDTRDDGSIVAALDVTNREAFRSFVLTFLEHAEVLKPDVLRRDMIEWLEALAS